MKKALALMLTLVMVLSLAACTKETAPAAQPAAQATDAPAQGQAEPAAPTEEPAKKLDFPTKAIDLVVGYSAGGGTFMSAQMLSFYEKNFGKPINMIAKPGSGGAIAADYIASQVQPDGYSLLYATASLPISIILGDVEFAPEDLVAVGQCTAVYSVIAVAADAPYNNVAELTEWIKANPGKFSWGYPGTGSSLHINGAYILNAMGVLDQTVGIPYDGTSESIAAVLGGHSSAASFYSSSIGDYVAAGKLKIIGVMAEERMELFPDIPTFLEQGVDVTMSGWRGVFAPADTPAEVLAYLEQTIGDIVNSDDYKARASELGEVVDYMNMTDFTAKYMSEIEALRPVVEMLGLLES